MSNQSNAQSEAASVCERESTTERVRVKRVRVCESARAASARPDRVWQQDKDLLDRAPAPRRAEQVHLVDDHPTHLAHQ
eukprot:5572963-Pleurochrysis_carterae.AAC.1